MPITRDQFSQMNFGYLNGSDLLQFCPSQLLTSQYDKFQQSIQNGCNQAYEELISELSNRYDIGKELSNANQKLTKQSGSVQMNISAGSYISKIVLTWDNPFRSFNLGQQASLSSPIIIGVGDNSPQVQIGTTSTGSEILEQNFIQYQKILFVNKYFPLATTLYFTISGGDVNIELTCNSGVQGPDVTIVDYLNQSESFTINIPANTYIYQIFGDILLSTPSISIGTTLGGVDIVPLTVVNNDTLPIVVNKNYFNTATTIYLTITGGSTNLHFYYKYNFVAPAPILNPTRNSFCVKLASILAIRNILGSVSGENTMLKDHFSWADRSIVEIKERQKSLTLDSPPCNIASRAHLVSSNYKTLG